MASVTRRPGRPMRRGHVRDGGPLTLALAVAALLGMARSGYAMPIGFDIGEGHLDLLSRYAWRGYDLGHGPVLAPSVRVGLAGREVTAVGPDGLFLIVRGAVPLADRERQRSADELDAGLWLEHRFDAERDGKLQVGYVEYGYPSGRSGLKHAREIGATVERLWAVSEDQGIRFWPHLSAAYNFVAFDAPYVAAGIRQSLGTRGTRLEVDLTVSASSFRQWGLVGSSAFGLHAIELNIRYSIEKPRGDTHLLIEPFLGVSRAAKRVNPDASEFWFGISVGFRR